MSYAASARTTTGRTFRPTVVGLVAITAAMVVTLVHQPASSSAPSFNGVLRGDHGGVTEADGVLADGVTVSEDEYPGIADLDSDLLRALRGAAKDAAADGIEFIVNSGWRSPQYQNQLLREAVAQYGSEAVAARWVATAETSEHVSGNAVDLGGVDATTWLSEHGAAYGLCQIYSNETWHYELRRGAIDGGCPSMYADPTRDPRMHPGSNVSVQP